MSEQPVTLNVEIVPSEDSSTDTPPSTTIIQEAPDLSGNVLDLVERVTRLEDRVTAVESTLADTSITAEVAENIATSASQAAIEAIDVAETALEVATEPPISLSDEPEVVPSIEPDRPAVKRHPLFRSREEWGF